MAKGKVVEVFPDKGGLVRVVKLKSKANTLPRLVSKLCLMLVGNSVLMSVEVELFVSSIAL